MGTEEFENRKRREDEEEEEEVQPQPLAQRQLLGDDLAGSLTEEKDTSETQIKKGSEEFFTVATDVRANKRRIHEIFDKYGISILKPIAAVCLDKLSNPKGDHRWGVIRTEISKYDNYWLEVFNAFVVKEANRRGRQS